MADPARRRATYDDVLLASPLQVAEVIDGELRLSPRPAKLHTFAASALGGELFAPFRRGRGGPGGWILLDEPELHLRDDIVVPDLAGWRAERIGVMTDDEPYFTLAPDWVCEVLSRSTAKSDRAQKLPIYARERVPYIWFLDPIVRTLEVFELDGATYRLLGVHRDEERVRARPFDAFELELGVLWAGVELDRP